MTDDEEIDLMGQYFMERKKTREDKRPKITINSNPHPSYRDMTNEITKAMFDKATKDDDTEEAKR